MVKTKFTKQTKETKDSDFNNVGIRSGSIGVGGYNSSMDMFAKSKFHIGNTSNFKSPANKINNVLDQHINMNVIDNSPKFNKQKSPYHLTPIATKNKKFTEDFITRTEKSNGFAE